MNRYFCRVCWNTNDWERPSGPPKDSGNTDSFGYGFDEWLRRSTWTVNGFRYAFLEPLHIPRKVGRAKVPDGDHDLILYTINPKTKARYFVGRINPCIVLNEAQALQVQRIYKKEGWLKLMEQEAKQFAGPSIYKNPPLMNVQFKLANMTFCSCLKVLPRGHFIYNHRFDRYSPREPRPPEWENAVERISAP